MRQGSAAKDASSALAAFCIAAATLVSSTAVEAETARVEAVVLGVAQDGGVPHAGCHQRLCVEARRDLSKRKMVASLGLLDHASRKRFLIDATPDFAMQMELLGGLPDAVLLTHSHVGHYLGLAQLGREILNARRVPIYCTPGMADFIRRNRPWSRLVERENVLLHEVTPGEEIELTSSLKVTAISVPHRDEDSDTVAYLVAGPSRRLLWLPDIDKWEKWERRIEDFTADPFLIAFLDGTFFRADEIPGRSIEEIPHPLVPETVERLSRDGGPKAQVYFVHLNHTNRLFWDPAAVSALRRRGFSVARERSRYSL